MTQRGWPARWHARLRSPGHLLLTTLLSIVLVSTACCGMLRRSTPIAGLYSEAQVTRGTVADVVEVTGQVTARNARWLTFGTVDGRVEEVFVRPGQHVVQGQPLVRIDTTAQERVLREAQADLSVAQATLAETEHTMLAVEQAKAEAEVASAEAGLAQAKLALGMAQRAELGPLQEAVSDAQAGLQLAQDQLRLQELSNVQSTIRTLEYQQAFYQRVLRDAQPDQDTSATQADLDAAERALTSARGSRDEALRTGRETVNAAQDELAKAQAAYTRASAGQMDPLTATRLAYDQAATRVDKARRALQELMAGGESADVKAAKTAWSAAQARVDSAEAAIAASTLTAPFDGEVSAVPVSIDDNLESSDNVVYVADMRDLTVKAQASEMIVARLSVGQAVRITLDAVSGRVFSGELINLAVRGQTDAGRSFYGLEASLEHENADIRPGMLANVQVVLDLRSDVLTIPSAAVLRREDQSAYVLLSTADGKLLEQPVEVGLDDGILAEVKAGLTEGQRVRVPLNNVLSKLIGTFSDVAFASEG